MKINLIFEDDRVWRIVIVEEEIKGKVERIIRRFDIGQSDPLDGPKKFEIKKVFYPQFSCYIECLHKCYTFAFTIDTKDFVDPDWPTIDELIHFYVAQNQLFEFKKLQSWKETITAGLFSDVVKKNFWLSETMTVIQVEMTPFVKSKVEIMDNPFIDILLADTGTCWDRISNRSEIFIHRPDFWPSRFSVTREKAKNSLVNGTISQPLRPDCFGITLEKINFDEKMREKFDLSTLETEKVPHGGKFITYFDEGMEFNNISFITLV